MSIFIALLIIIFGHVNSAEGRKVSVGVPVLDVTQSALFVANDRGYYRQEGLEVDLILMREAVANQALIAGNVEFTTVPTAGLQAALQGAPLKVVFSRFQKPTLGFMRSVLPAFISSSPRAERKDLPDDLVELR